MPSAAPIRFRCFRCHKLLGVSRSKAGAIVADSSTAQTLAGGASASVTQRSVVDHPHLWNGVSDPYLHDLYVEIRDANSGELLDLVHQRVGIRSFAIDPARGFLLNGQVYDLHGGMYQQDHRNEGWAVTDADIRSVLLLDYAYADPGVGKFGLKNAVFPIGETFLEVVSPKQDGTTAGRLLEKRGGDGGYMVILQCEDPKGRDARVERLGIRIVHKSLHADYDGRQLHPRDTGGSFLEGVDSSGR